MRKVVKIFLIVIAVILLIPIIALATFKIKNESFIGSADKEFVDYLKQHKTLIDTKIFSIDKLLFSDVHEKSFYLLGEIHGYAEVQSLDKSLFFHLNKTKGVRYYVSEIDSVASDMINAFLQKEDKDTNLLKEFVLRVKETIPQQGGNELFLKWSDIYDYNLQLADSLKIEVIGIDFRSRISSTKKREDVMKEVLTDAIEKKRLQHESFYGFFGLIHVLQNGINSSNFQPLAARLKSEGLNVVSLLCFDVDSDVYLPKGMGYLIPDDEKTSLMSTDGPIFMIRGINDLKSATEKNTITLFKLDEENSPYKNSQKLISAKANFLGQSFAPCSENMFTTDFFQYVILLRNCNAVTPIQ